VIALIAGGPPLNAAKTVSAAFEEFLEDQKARISERTLLKYRNVIDLYSSYLERYWPGHDDESAQITAAGGSYCETFGPEAAVEGFGEFLNYFMPRKVICGADTMNAAGTVLKKLAKWLADRGYVNDTEFEQERAGRAARDLPRAVKVLEILSDVVDDYGQLDRVKSIQDHFWIDKIEPGKLWLKPLIYGDGVIGPISVPESATALCQLNWDIGGVVVKVGRKWRFAEVWNVSP
jgi:hypothetical protein